MEKILYIVVIISVFLICTSATRYEIQTDSLIVQKSKEIAISQVGVHEATGRNDGYKVEEYLESVGLSKGNSWCCAFQYWCYDSAAVELNLPNPLYKTGLANGEFTYAMRKGERTRFLPNDNDLIVWKYTSNNSGHIERIINVLGYNTVETIGGNVGNCVKINIRHISSPLGRMHVRGNIGL